MAHLTLAGRTADGTRLRLVDDSGGEFTLDVDDALVSTVGADPGEVPDRHGQLETTMDSTPATLRPRDIQARIRAGETAEQVARAAQTTVEKVMPYAAPVLAERAHVAERAQLSSVRRSGEGSGARTLGESVTARLQALNVDPGSVEWDAWRREDGRWTLVGVFGTSRRTGSATFSYDQRGSFVTLDDDDARWLVGELDDDPVDETPQEAPARRLSAVPAHDPDQLELGDDAISMVEEPDVPAASGTVADEDETVELEATPAESTEHSAGHAPDPAEHPAEHRETGELHSPEPETPEPKRASRRRGRASVPSWDEIMFGGGKSD